MARKPMDLNGKTVGYLKVISIHNSVDSSRNRYWLCVCECGKQILVSATRLNNGRIKSCGCHNGDNFRKHGFRNTRVYTIWSGMKQRCDNNKNHYKNVTYCKEWKNFMPFYEWSISNGYSDELTLDRIDVTGNYEPSNCRWVNQKVQQNNRSNNTIYSFNGETHTLSEWSDITGIDRSTLSARILKLKWSVEKALSTPLQKAR